MGWGVGAKWYIGTLKVPRAGFVQSCAKRAKDRPGGVTSSSGAAKYVQPPQASRPLLANTCVLATMHLTRLWAAALAAVPASAFRDTSPFMFFSTSECVDSSISAVLASDKLTNAPAESSSSHPPSRPQAR